MQEFLTAIQGGTVTVPESGIAPITVNGPTVPISAGVTCVRVRGAGFAISPKDVSMQIEALNISVVLQLNDTTGAFLATIWLGAVVTGNLFDESEGPASTQGSGVLEFNPKLLQGAAQIGSVQLSGGADLQNTDAAATHGATGYLSGIIAIE